MEDYDLQVNGIGCPDYVGSQSIWEKKRQSDKIIPIYLRSFRLRNWLFTNIVNIISCEEGMKSWWFPHGITDSGLVVVKNGGMEQFKS